MKSSQRTACLFSSLFIMALNSQLPFVISINVTTQKYYIKIYQEKISD